MVVTNKVAYIGGAVLAVLAAIVVDLHIQGVLGIAWTTGIGAALPFAAVFGVQLLTPSQIAQKIPAQVAAAIGTGLSGLNVLILQLHIPGWLQIVVGTLDTASAAVGIAVTGVQLSKGAKALLAKSHASVPEPAWEANVVAVARLVVSPLSPLFMLLAWMMRNLFGVNDIG